MKTLSLVLLVVIGSSKICFADLPENSDCEDWNKLSIVKFERDFWNQHRTEPDCNNWFSATGLPLKVTDCRSDCASKAMALKDKYYCSEQCEALCATKAPTSFAYYANGIWNTHESAEESLTALRDAVIQYASTLPNEDATLLRTEWKQAKVAYNISKNQVVQLFEVLAQFGITHESKIFRYLSGLEQMPTKIAAALTEESDKLFAAWKGVDADLSEQVETYDNHAQKNELTFILAHSQGNLYANAALTLLRKKQDANNYFPVDAYEVVPVASPINYSIPAVWVGGFITLKSDTLIRGIPGSPPAEISNPGANIFEHQFIKYYLNGETSRQQILSEIRCSAKRRYIRSRFHD